MLQIVFCYGPSTYIYIPQYTQNTILICKASTLYKPELSWKLYDDCSSTPLLLLPGVPLCQKKDSGLVMRGHFVTLLGRLSFACHGTCHGILHHHSRTAPLQQFRTCFVLALCGQHGGIEQSSSAAPCCSPPSPGGQRRQICVCLPRAWNGSGSAKSG